MKQFLRQTMVVARRDFVAIVFTPTFLIFLLAPLLMLSFGAVGGGAATMLADAGEDRSRIVALVEPDDGAAIAAADKRLRRIYRTMEAPPALELRRPAGEPAEQAEALFARSDIEPAAVMFGPLDRPTIRHTPQGERSARYLAELAEQALRDRLANAPASLSEPVIVEVRQGAATDGGRRAAGFGAIFAIFLLTLLLAGQAVGMLAEERGNKVIEILAASVPLESVFLGKLIGMFGVAILFVGFWGTLLSQAIWLLPDGAASLLALKPAVGLGAFLLLFAAYFTMAFLLLSAVFLGVGAQASTMREIQMLSLPITIFQVAMFGLSAAAAGAPESTIAAVARVFPFSSPFAMAAYAATEPALWPHLLALAWQALWVLLTVTVAARAFRAGVLKSGGGWRRLFARA